MQKIKPFLWFDTQAQEAMNFYVSVFKNARVIDVNRAGDRVTVVSFQLEDQLFTAFNAGPQFKFTEAISFVVDCKSQEEVDELWEKLSDGGEQGHCGWLKDKYGLSWQIIPSALVELLTDEDAEKSRRVMDAMMQMGKIDIAQLRRAGETA